MKRVVFLCVVAGMFAVGLCVGVAQVEANDKQVDLDKMTDTIKWLQEPCRLDFLDMSLEDILDAFKKRSPSLSFDLENEVIPNAKITIKVDNKPMGQALQKMLVPFKWTYAVKPDGQILLRPLPARNDD